jgi:translation initiation factor IF-2
MSLGMFVSINQRLSAETIVIVAEEFGYKVEFVTAEETVDVEEETDAPEDLKPRPPIVTVMGHVDHGKTSLLDYIRKANVIAGEAGGITQHIGAYGVTLENGKRITFLDTPGHEAFTAMRARGAQVTDVVIVVVAADDNVMPQTKEAINHAQAAGVPIVFAINKMDKPGANADKIREELSAINILVEEWGGKYQCQEVSAKKGTNIDLLLEKVLLEADLLDLKGNPTKNAVGTVIESSLDKGRGYVTTLLVQSGALEVGDVVLAGSHSGRVKAMTNERGVAIKKAGPSTPVLLLGLSGAATAGDKFKVMDDEREAREIANRRMQLLREQGYRSQKHITLDEIGRRLAIGDFKELNIIVKGDVDGSIEALTDALLKLSTEKVQVNVIHKSVGQVTESDVLLASASNAIVVGFQVRPSANARKLAEQEQIDIRLYSIIYDAINEVKAAMEGLLAPEFEEKVVCNVQIRQVFKISKVGSIAGCMVMDGKITRNTKVRIIRDGIVVHTGTLGSLKRFKDDVKEVASGYECGLNIDGYNDIKEGDLIEGYEMVEIKKKL